MNDVALILAAGASRRLGRPKQLVVVDGETLVARAVRVAREAGLHPVVVTGCEAELVGAAVDAELVHNDAWADGMGGSIAVGVSAIATTAASITIMTCDQLRVTAADLERIAAAAKDVDIVAAAYDGVVGVPSRFAPSCYSALMELQGDVGAQALIRGGKLNVASVAMDGARFDVDEPADV